METKMKSAEEILDELSVNLSNGLYDNWDEYSFHCICEIKDKHDRIEFDKIIHSAMNTRAEQAVREFARRVQRDSFYKVDDSQIDLLRDQLITEIKNQK